MNFPSSICRFQVIITATAQPSHRQPTSIISSSQFQKNTIYIFNHPHKIQTFTPPSNQPTTSPLATNMPSESPPPSPEDEAPPSPDPSSSSYGPTIPDIESKISEIVLLLATASDGGAANPVSEAQFSTWHEEWKTLRTELAAAKLPMSALQKIQDLESARADIITLRKRLLYLNEPNFIRREKWLLEQERIESELHKANLELRKETAAAEAKAKANQNKSEEEREEEERERLFWELLAPKPKPKAKSVNEEKNKE
ncbi:hypothetical protein B0H66DRAFT_107870 [Apodospora peruviana]|uniref:Uncharacterized protein n=1 Tax=Apodospora peruviana TaxID=516989 RepID=A0AAE0IGX9_9PEZI|nr:hypothetical protein B0H66DRAFT_107870 [Apodospora peruviana]